MTQEEYQAAVRNCYMFVSLMAADDSSSTIMEKIKRCDSIGPLLDPTAWIKSGDKFRQDKEAVEMCYEFHRKEGFPGEAR